MQGPPIPLNRFVGRERELADVAALLTSERLVTLTGSGGSGKTRLAIEVAAREAGAAAGDVAWVDLSAVAAADMVALRVAAALRIADLPGHSAEASLQNALRSRPAVLVLDCCEHLVGACARLAGLLLRTCAPLRILATSREPLGVEGERVYPVPPLSLPDVGDGGRGTDAATAEAVRLFVERAHAVLPSFALTDANASAVARICHRLDGIPLAIELAAARMRVLTPHQLAERLDDLFNVLTGGARDALPRHRTLRAAMDWSYELLADAERRLLERLSVFAGGFTLEAAEEVAPGDGVEAGDVLDLLAALVEKSLVTMRERHGTARYGLLEIVRQYALERLRGGGGEDRARMRHARWLAALLEGESLALMRAEPGALDRVAAEGDNIRAALDWCGSAAAAEAVELGLRLASGIWPFWFFRAQRQDGRRRLEGLLARSGSEPTHARAAALHGAGMLAWWLGDAEEARRHLDAGVEAWRSLSDEPWLVLALAHSAQPLQDLGEEDAALVRAEEAADLARASGDPWLLAFSHCTGIGYVRSRRGEFEQADRIFAEVEGLVEAGNHPWPLGVARYGRAVGAWQQGDLPRAERHGRAALEPLLAYGDPIMAARAILVLAYVEGERSAFERAGLLLGVAEALTASVGGRLLAMDTPRVERLRARIREAMGTASADAARERGRAMELSRALACMAPESQDSSPESQAPPPVGKIAPPPGTPRAPDLQVLALGPLRILRGGAPLEQAAFGSSKPRELLLFLLSDPGGRTRDEVGAALWPDASTAQVRNSFHVTLHRLRKTLGDAEWVEHDGERYRLATGRVATLDGVHFEHAATRALRRLRAGGGDPDAVALRDALALYRGDFLEGEIVGSWAWEPRDRWKALCVEGLSELASWLAARGRDDEAAAAFRTLLQREDLSEEAYRGLMTIHARRGEEDEALRLHRQLRLLLREELDTEPEPATEALARRIETRQPV